MPGLKSHVFVGPFTAPKAACIGEEDDDIVCLEDEEIKVLEPNKEKDDEEEPVIEKQKEEKKDSLLKRRLLGEIPLLVEKNETEDNVDVFETQISEVNQAKSLKRIMNREVSSHTEDLSDLKPSEYGKLVQRQSERKVDSSSKTVDIQFRVAEEDRKYSGFLESSGKVILPHPNHKDREVICSNVEDAKLWLESHFETVEKEDFDDEEVLFDDPEPLPSEPPKVKTPPPILKRIKTPLLPSGKSNKKIALFVQMKQQKDEAQLFYELGHTAFNKNFFNKNVPRAKILDKALEEINILQAEGREMELSKQNLLKRRTKLFELFTKSLNGLPVAKKKAAVIELKELLRKDKERKEAGSKCPEPVVASSNVPTSSIKKVARRPSQSKEQTLASSGPTPYTDATGINTLRPDGTVLRPMNAFMLWAKDRRSPLLAQGLGISQVSQVRLLFLQFFLFVFIVITFV